MSNTETTGNATNQPIPQYPPSLNFGGVMGGIGSPYGPHQDMIDTISALRDRVVQLEGKINILTALIKK
jgi:hypothetical protein